MLALAGSAASQTIMRCLDASGNLVITNEAGAAGLKCSSVLKEKEKAQGPSPHAYVTAGVPPARVGAVSAGGRHTCGVKTDGSLACWGLDDYGQATPPAGQFTQVSAGFLHTCGVKTDGSLACWGRNDSGQATPPTGQFTQVSAGQYHACGVRRDGTLACWGRNGNGEATPPAGPFSQVSAGAGHTCGAKRDGTLACWGSNRVGEVTPPAGPFTQVSAGFFRTCGVKGDGSLACWGEKSLFVEDDPPAGRFRQVSAGGNTCGVRTDGSLACWGDNRLGRATPPAGAFTQVSVGAGHACGVKGDGSLACWGDNSLGQAPGGLTWRETAVGRQPVPAEAPTGEAWSKRAAPEAARVLERVRAHYGALKGVSVNPLHRSTETVEGVERRPDVVSWTVLAARPNRVAMWRTDVKVSPFILVGDGKVLWTYLGNMYEGREAPASFGGVIDVLGLDPEFDFTRQPQPEQVLKSAYLVVLALLDWARFEAVLAGAEKIEYVGRENVGGSARDRIRIIAPRLDADLWVRVAGDPWVDRIEPDERKQLVLHGKAMIQRVRQELLFEDWRVRGAFPAGSFSFKPPAGAEKVDSIRGWMMAPR